MVLIYAVNYGPEIAVVGTNEIREDIMGRDKSPMGWSNGISDKAILETKPPKFENKVHVGSMK